MDKMDLSYHLGIVEEKLSELYDLWREIPTHIKDELERLFTNDQGVGYHIYRAWENIKEIDHDSDIDEVYKKF